MNMATFRQWFIVLLHYHYFKHTYLYLYHFNFFNDQGQTQVEALNDSGSLKGLIKAFPKAESKLCTTCGSVRYINCPWCQGSKKSLQHAFANGEYNIILISIYQL